MTSADTKSIPAEQCKQLFEQQIPGHEARQPIEQETRTDYVGVEDFRREVEALKLRFGLKCVGYATIAVLVSHMQATAEGEQSRPVGTHAMADLEFLASPAVEYSLAEFHEPIEFAWRKSAHVIRQAAKQFIEDTYADY